MLPPEPFRVLPLLLLTRHRRQDVQLTTGKCTGAVQCETRLMRRGWKAPRETSSQSTEGKMKSKRKDHVPAVTAKTRTAAATVHVPRSTQPCLWAALFALVLSSQPLFFPLLWRRQPLFVAQSLHHGRHKMELSPLVPAELPERHTHASERPNRCAPFHPLPSGNSCTQRDRRSTALPQERATEFERSFEAQ